MTTGKRRGDDVYAPNLDALARRALTTLRNRRLDAAKLFDGSTPFEELDARSRESLRDLAADVAAANLADFLAHAAEATGDVFAARYRFLLALVDNPRLLFLSELVVSAAERGHEITRQPVELLVVRILFFISQITYDFDGIKKGCLYPNHQIYCNVNSLISTAPCNCGEEERLLRNARLRAHSPDLSDDDLKDIFAAINRGEGDHGSFLRAFAEAFCRADRDNLTHLRPAAFAFAEQYNLTRYLPGEGRAA